MDDKPPEVEDNDGNDGEPTQAPRRRLPRLVFDDLHLGCATFLLLVFVSWMLAGISPWFLLTGPIGFISLIIYMRYVRDRPRFANGLWLGILVGIGLCILLIGLCFVFPPSFH